MLKITVELLPAGISAFRRTLGVMTIGNITDLADISSYEISAMEAENPLAGTRARSASARVDDHNRRQSVWNLIRAATSELQGAEWDEL